MRKSRVRLYSIKPSKNFTTNLVTELIHITLCLYIRVKHVYFSILYIWEYVLKSISNSVLILDGKSSVIATYVPTYTDKYNVLYNINTNIVWRHSNPHYVMSFLFSTGMYIIFVLCRTCKINLKKDTIWYGNILQYTINNILHYSLFQKMLGV